MKNTRQYYTKGKLTRMTIASNNYLMLSLKTNQGIPEAYSDPYQTSKMEHFAEIVNGFQPLTIFAQRYILDLHTVIITLLMILVILLLLSTL